MDMCSKCMYSPVCKYTDIYVTLADNLKKCMDDYKESMLSWDKNLMEKMGLDLQLYCGLFKKNSVEVR